MDECSPSIQEKVLLADDNPTNLFILRTTLEKTTGYQLLVAESGQEALEVARREKPSLLLLDIVMPDLSGYDVCKALKSDPETRDVAVIFLSALDDSSSKLKGFAAGGVDYISKPFQTDEVIARVKTHVKIHRLERFLALRNNELEEENHRILHAVGEGIIAVDADSVITQLNPAAEALTGWSAADVIGESLLRLNLFQGEMVQRSSDWDSPPSTRAFKSDHEVIRCKLGEERAVSVGYTPRQDGGGVLVLRDISESLEIEERLRQVREEMELQRQNFAHTERLNLSGEMTAGIAHEVNQPLTAVVNYTQVLRRLLATEQVGDLAMSVLDKLEVQAMRASEVIQNLRDFFRKPESKHDLIDLNQLLKGVVELAEVDSRVNDVMVHLSLDSDLPTISGNYIQLQQVALNLTRNAIEAMADNPQDRYSGVVIVSGYDGEHVYFTVLDRGLGIEKEAQDNLFTPFYSTKEGGMGIGLSICESIVRSHGGRLLWRHRARGGVAFTCELPAAEAESLQR